MSGGRSAGGALRWITQRRADEAGARLVHRKAARQEHIALEEEAGQPERIGELLGWRRMGVPVISQERGQPQHALAPRLPGDARNRAARFRRDIDELGRAAGCGALLEVEPE